MKRILLPLLALSIVFISCNRDNDSDITNLIENPVEQGDLLAEIITEEGSLSTQFIYDGNKIKSSNWTDGNISYTYIGDQITAIHRDKGLLGAWDIKYTYTPNGTLHSAYEIHNYESPNNNDREIMEKHKTISIREYTYAGNNTINVKETSDNYIIKKNTDEKINSNVVEYTFTMNNGNIISKIIKPQDRLSNTDTLIYTYDDNVNPLHNIKGFSALAIDFNIMYLTHINGNKNNILSEKYTSFDSRGIEKERDSYQDISKYEYNSKGYPTKQTTIFSSTPNGRIEHTVISNYTYK